MRAGRRGSELPARSASVDQHDEHDGVEAGVGQDGYPGNLFGRRPKQTRFRSVSAE